MFNRNENAKSELYALIDSYPELEGAGVGYVGDSHCEVLRASAHLTGIPTYIILEETEYVPISAPEGDFRPMAPKSGKNARTSGLSKQLVGAGINCGSAILTGMAATAGAAAAPVTGGASGIITLIAGAAALASAAQCGISIGLVMVELSNPGDAEEYFESEEWYQWTSNILDGVNLVGIVAGAPGSFKSLSKILKMRNTTGKTIVQILRGLNGKERKVIAEELAKASQQLSNKQWKRLVRAGKLPKIYTNSAIKATLKEQLLSNISNVLDIYDSNRGGNVGYLVHILQE